MKMVGFFDSISDLIRYKKKLELNMIIVCLVENLTILAKFY